MFFVAVASSVLALRARSIASFTSARSPVRGAAASLRGVSFDGFDLRWASASLVCRRLPTATWRWGRASFASYVSPGVLLLGILLLGIGPRCRLCREQGEGGEREDTGQRA